MTGDGEAAHDLRAKPRYKLFQPSEMTLSGATTRVHILNLSATGALVHAAEPPAPGTSLRLRPGQGLRPARVVWTRGRRFGVAFSTPLADAQVDSVIADQEALIAEASRRFGPARWAA